MESVSPVWTEEEVPIEHVIALDQPQYIPIIVLPIIYSDGMTGMAVRFRFSPEERQEIANGKDLVITELTFDRPFTPLSLTLCAPDKAPLQD